MQHFRELLKTENSSLARVARLGLRMLQAALQETIEDNPSDPAINACKELLKDLDDLLCTTKIKKDPAQAIFESEAAHTSQNIFTLFEASNHQPIPIETNKLKLSGLRDSFMDDKALKAHLGLFKLESNTDEDLWNEIQRSLLRLPSSLANTWRQKAKKLAGKEAAYEDRQAVLPLPFNRSEVIYPGLCESVNTKGLGLSVDVSCDSRISEETLDGDLDFFARLVSFYVKFIELDPFLHHALQSIDRFGLRSLESEQEKNKYVDALIYCFKQVQATEKSSDPSAILQARLDLDEAIHSLVYHPPAEGNSSWWSKLQQEAREKLLAKAREYDNVKIRQLWGTYADVRSLSKYDLELDSGGIRGEVLACLRVYAKINDTVFPGRVLFRSLR